MVTLILMIVISLIVVGFAQISRRNSRQALDRQLSTQAFYAAETGVNDVRNLVKTAVLTGQNVPEKTDCGPGSGATAAFYAGLDPDLDNTGQDEAEYTCVMVDPTPETLLYSNIGTDSLVVPVISANGSNISTAKLVWQTKDNTTTPTTSCPTSTSGVFTPTGASWSCGYGVLRVDLVPTDGTFDYAGLQNRTMTTFLVPQRPGSAGSTNTTPYAAGGANNRIGINCTDTDCNLTFTGLSTNQYYVRVSSIYKEVSLQLNAFNSSGTPLELQGAQAVIDATGKAQDVLRRIQVHVPLTPSSVNRLSDYSMQSTDAICKRFIIMDNYFDSQVSGVTSTNPLCAP
jgi:hypothetical protein